MEVTRKMFWAGREKFKSPEAEVCFIFCFRNSKESCVVSVQGREKMKDD